MSSMLNYNIAPDVDNPNEEDRDSTGDANPAPTVLTYPLTSSANEGGGIVAPEVKEKDHTSPCRT